MKLQSSGGMENGSDGDAFDELFGAMLAFAGKQIVPITRAITKSSGRREERPPSTLRKTYFGFMFTIIHIWLFWIMWKIAIL